MVDASNGAAACQEDGCVELLPATAEEEAQLRMPESKAPQRLSWRSSAVLVLACAAAALVGAVVAAATGGKHLSHPATAATSDSLAFFTEPYEDPQGQTVCSATSKGSCKCECAWAKAIGACEQRRDDGTCCYSCCCPNAGGQSPDQSENDYFNNHADAAYRPAETRAYRGSIDPSTHTTIHVTHHYDHHHAIHEDSHYHAIHEGSLQVYHVGEHVYVRANDGRAWAAEVVDVNMDGTYRVRYLADHYRGRSVLVSASNMFRQRGSGFFGPRVWWLIFGGILVALCGLACYLYRTAPR